MAEDNTHFGHWTWRNQVSTGKEASFSTGCQYWKVLRGLLWGEKSSTNLPNCELGIADFCAQHGTSTPQTVLVYAMPG